MLKLFRKKAVEPELPPPAFSIGDGHRVYAVGDIHGRADLFNELLDQIKADESARAAMPSQLILLGDLVDRGPQSAQTIEKSMELAAGDTPIRFLKGNHEEVFVRSAMGDVSATRFFIRIGGRETILSYGLDEADYTRMEFDELTDWMLNHIPRAHIDFIDGFEDWIEIGDYLFVHAGIRPDVPMPDQSPSDLRWIRDEFLSWTLPHQRLVIHGHTITDGVDQRVNRIGIDTGAYQSGKLTAIGLQGTERWFISTGE